MKANIENLGLKHSDIKKALGHLALDSELTVIQKNQYALEAEYLDSDYILLTIHKEKVIGSQQYFYYADLTITKSELLEVLYV